MSTDTTTTIPEGCTGPFSDARDCPVHRPPSDIALAQLLTRGADAVSALAALAALKPEIIAALTNDTLMDKPDVERDYYLECECEDCGRLRIDVLRKLLALLPDPPQET